MQALMGKPQVWSGGGSRSEGKAQLTGKGKAGWEEYFRTGKNNSGRTWGIGAVPSCQYAVLGDQGRIQSPRVHQADRRGGLERGLWTGQIAHERHVPVRNLSYLQELASLDGGSLFLSSKVILNIYLINYKKSYFLTGGKLLYNVVLFSVVQQCESAIIIHISPPSRPPIPLLQVIIEHQAGLPALYSNFPPAIYLLYR